METNTPVVHAEDSNWLRRFSRDLERQRANKMHDRDDILDRAIDTLERRAQKMEHRRTVMARSRAVTKEFLMSMRPDILRRIHNVIEVVARHFEMPVTAILGDGRHRLVSHPRHIAEWCVCKTMTDISVTEIGYAFHRDHSTILYGRNKTDSMRYHHADFKEMTDKLLAMAKTVDSGVTRD